MKPRQEVTCTDSLCLLVREQALTSGAKVSAEAALDAVIRQPNEAWATATARVVKSFRAAFANADRVCVSETQFFWRVVTEANIRTLLTRFADVLSCPTLSNVPVCLACCLATHTAHFGVHTSAAPSLA